MLLSISLTMMPIILWNNNPIRNFINDQSKMNLKLFLNNLHWLNKNKLNATFKW